MYSSEWPAANYRNRETLLHGAGRHRGKYDRERSGGPWDKGVHNQCRSKIYTHDEDFYDYFLGVRSCAEPDQSRRTTPEPC